MHLDIQVGEHAIDYANIAQKEKLSELQLRLRQLLDQVEQITKEQNYQRVTNILMSDYSRISSSYNCMFSLSSIARSVLGRHPKARIAVCFGGR